AGRNLHRAGAKRDESGADRILSTDRGHRHSADHRRGGRPAAAEDDGEAEGLTGGRLWHWQSIATWAKVSGSTGAAMTRASCPISRSRTSPAVSTLRTRR